MCPDAVPLGHCVAHSSLSSNVTTLERLVFPDGPHLKMASLLARGLPQFLADGRLRWTAHNVATCFIKAIKRECGKMEIVILCDIITEATSPHIYWIPLIRRKLLG